MIGFFVLTDFAAAYDSFCLFFFLGGLECVGIPFAYVAHLVFLRDVLIRTQRVAVASGCATNLDTHLHFLAQLYIMKKQISEEIKI
jgi:hypothetical protein